MTDINAPNTDPATYTGIGQDPNHPPGWNVVSLSDGSIWKFGGIVERLENGIIVQRIALTENKEGGQAGPDGPVITPDIAVQLEAAGAVIPPIHETKIIPADPPVGSLPPIPVPLSNPPTGSTPAAHLSWIQKVRAELDDLEAWVKSKL